MLSARFDQAMLLAHELHRRQTRKATATPYIAHLLAVTALVIENGGDEDQAIAALLHDAVEDQGGVSTLERIRAEFGERVADLVAALSDADTIPKPPWRERKERYLAHLREAPEEVLLISACDKLHNARAIVEDHAAVGGELWARFSGGREGTIWYYESLVEVFGARGPGRVAALLGELVARMGRLP